jgi:hypothetical protein
VLHFSKNTLTGSRAFLSAPSGVLAIPGCTPWSSAFSSHYYDGTIFMGQKNEPPKNPLRGGAKG